MKGLYPNMKANRLSWLIIIIITAGMVSACQPQPAAIQQQPPQAIPTVTLHSIFATPQMTVTPLVVSEFSTPMLVMDHSAWLTYTNIHYGFSFQYPPQWKLLEQDKKEPHYIKFSTNSLILIIGYKWSSEAKTITGGGTLPGTLQTAGFVNFLGQPTPKIFITEGSKVKSIFYNGINAEIPVQASHQGLVFSIRLIPEPGSDYHTIDIPESTQKELDAVLQTFVLHDQSRPTLPVYTEIPLTASTPLPIPAEWRQWENFNYGFRFQYPADWKLEEQPHLIKISQDGFSLLIGYRLEDEKVNLGPDPLPPGELQPQYTLPFLNQQITKQLLIYNNKQKAILYGNKEMAVYQPYKNQTIRFVILGYDFQADYDTIDLANRLQATLDLIVSSFQWVDNRQTPHSTVTPTAALMLGQPTWKDDFERSDQWYMLQTANARFSVSNGKLIMLVTSPSSMDEWGISRVSGLNDFYLEGNFITGEACSGLDRYGFLFRAPQPNAGYVVNFSCDGRYRLYLWDGSQFKSLISWTTSSAIHSGPNQTNALGVSAVGSSITLYANRTELASVTDSTYPSGSIGLLIGSAETPNFSVLVEDVSFWQK